MGHSNLRKGRYSQSGQIYSLTFTTKKRMPIFNFEIGRLFIHSLKKLEEKHSHRVLCFCVMPDHVHLLLQLGDSMPLSKSIQALKSESSKKIMRANGLSEGIWETAFHDRAIRSDEDIQNIARYIVANPMRAGIVRSLREYPLWDAVWV